MERKKAILLAGVVVVAMLLAQIPINALDTTPSTEKMTIRKEITSIHKPLGIGMGGNVLISADNPDADDWNPKITRGAGYIVVSYIKEISLVEQSIMVAYSADNGESWTGAFEFNSLEFTSGSGVLQSPDIKYCPAADEFFLAMIDPLAEMYNHEMAWIPGDIGAAESAMWWGISGVDSSGYEEAALTYCANDWLVSVSTEESSGLEKTLGLIYAYHDKEADDVLLTTDVFPGGAGGFYYDGNSVLETAPSYKPEMATGANRMYLVTEHYNEAEGKYQIAFKATVTSEDPLLTTSGGGPGGMDKYADIEVWPWQMYVADGTDPDVSASGTNLCIVYTQDGVVKCSYTSTEPAEGDSYTFSVSEIGPGAYPAVYVSGNHVYCAYVNNGNLYIVESEDGGATWGEPEQINDVDGTVAMEPGTVDICDAGVVWTDTRNGNNDIYFDSLGVPAPVINIEEIKGGFGVKATVTNTGGGDAENVEWTITFDGPVFIGKEKSGTVTVPAGGTVTISSGLILGIGPATVTVDVGGATKTASGFVLGPLVLGMK